MSPASRMCCAAVGAGQTSISKSTLSMVMLAFTTLGEDRGAFPALHGPQGSSVISGVHHLPNCHYATQSSRHVQKPLK